MAKLVLTLGSLLLLIQSANCVCFFNPDMQGHYLTQSTTTRGSDIDYLEVVILQNAIPIWGKCHRRFGDNVILYDMAGNMECMRCLHIVARSSQILEIHTEGLERCYTNEGAALTKCPTAETIAKSESVEIMLYKTRDLMQGRLPSPVYCPIEGQFRMTYDIDDGTESKTECPEPTTQISNCPNGNQIAIKFNQCSFEDFEKSFECLGSWKGRNGVKFLALRDPTVDHTAFKKRPSNPPVPKYRCAMYEDDELTGEISLSFSSDSTCFNNLHSPTNGFESLVLHPQNTPLLPHIVNQSHCEFPGWSRGKWEHLRVDRRSLMFTDLQELKKFSVHCVDVPARTGIYPVYTQNHCGDESFSCLAVEERSPNVIEFRISSNGEPFYHSGLCDYPSQLDWPRWITQGRVDRFKKSPCPVAGEYVGIIPDEPSLCAKLYSDCNNLEIMFYSVYDCNNRSAVYEEREYRCLGQWAEYDVTYTYTERRDVIGYECFAGVVMTTDEVYIVEAGVSCQRGLKPLRSGMRLLKQAACGFPGHPRGTQITVWKDGLPPFYTEVDNEIGDEYSSEAGSPPTVYSGAHLISILVLLILR